MRSYGEKLSPRELQIMELLAWGAERKEVPGLLQRQYGGREISVHTVNNTVANIFSKLSLQNEKELAAYYFCEYQGVPRGKSPLKQLRRSLYAILLLAVMLPQLTNLDQMTIPSAVRATSGMVRGAGRTARTNGGRRCNG